MFRVKRGMYYEDKDIIYSTIYGNGFYQWTGQEVQDPIEGDRGNATTSPLIENIKTNEKFFIKWVKNDKNVPLYFTYKVKNPPYGSNIFWPTDLVRIEEKNKVECGVFVDKIYSVSHERKSKYGNWALLFPYGGYEIMENGERYLNKIGELNWNNEKVRSLVVKIVQQIDKLNQCGYLYLDFHFSQIFITESDEVYLNFSNLLFRYFGKTNTQSPEAESFEMGPGNYPIEFLEPAIDKKIQKHFDKRSQNYSMAAMMFYLLFGRYAYDGRLMDGYRDESEREHYDKFRDYLKLDVFIFDPDDNSNALGDFADEENVIKLWDSAPKLLKELFIVALKQDTAERKGTCQPPTTEEWLKCFQTIGWI